MTHVKLNEMHFDVMGSIVVLGVVISKVCFPWGPLNGQLVLVDSIWDPVKTHVHGFGPFQFVVLAGSKSTGCGIVGDNTGRPRLGMAYLLEDLANEHSLLAIME